MQCCLNKDHSDLYVVLKNGLKEWVEQVTVSDNLVSWKLPCYRIVVFEKPINTDIIIACYVFLFIQHWFRFGHPDFCIGRHEVQDRLFVEPNRAIVTAVNRNHLILVRPQTGFYAIFRIGNRSIVLYGRFLST